MEMRPLNIFQRCIRVWEETHPYNAAQILEVAGKADIGKISDAWNEVLGTSGLGVARVEGKYFCYDKAPPQEVAVVDPGLGLDGFITQEMNRPFDVAVAQGARRGTFTMMPFRPFVLQMEGSHHMGVMYQHWVADSISLRMLLREWFCRLHDPAKVTGRALDVPHGGFWRFFGPKRTGWKFGSGVAALLRSTRQFKGARRLEQAGGAQHVDCSVHRLPDGMVDDLLAAARKRKVTLNDLFMAALARACDAHGPAPRQSEKALGLGTIVDLRASSPANLENTFSLFLGFTALVVPGEVLRDPDALLANIAMQNSRQKEQKAAQMSMLRMAAGYAQGRLLSRRQLEAFYRSYMPLWGGVSNVNMNRSWPAEYHPSPLVNYVRVAPTGPMVPVVIAVTTIGKRFSFVLTRRSSLVDESRGKQLAQAFVDELTARAKMG
jgi:hypothetical protein